MKNPYTTEIPYMVEHIEQRAEKLYNTYRNKHPHNTPALNVQQLTYDLGGKIWLNPDVNRLLNTAELDINDYTLNPETQQWENINFNSYIPYLTLHEQKTGTIGNVFTRFRLAHNLGHLYLHILNNKTGTLPDSHIKTPLSQQEREANRFAAVRKYLNITQEELDKLVEDHLILKLTDGKGRNGYPVFQFKNGTIRPDIQKIIKTYLDFPKFDNPYKTPVTPQEVAFYLKVDSLEYGGRNLIEHLDKYPEKLDKEINMLLSDLHHRRDSY